MLWPLLTLQLVFLRAQLQVCLLSGVFPEGLAFLGHFLFSIPGAFVVWLGADCGICHRVSGRTLFIAFSGKLCQNSPLRGRGRQGNVADHVRVWMRGKAWSQPGTCSPRHHNSCAHKTSSEDKKKHVSQYLFLWEGPHETRNLSTADCQAPRTLRTGRREAGRA